MTRKLTALAAGLAIALVAAAPAGAKSVSQIPATCSDATVAHGVFMSQGKLTQLGFGANTAGNWTVVAQDGLDGSTWIDYTSDFGASWEVITQRDASRGFHQIAVNATNNTTGEVCSTMISWKV